MEEISDLTERVVEFLLTRKERLVAEIEKEVESSVPVYRSLPADVITEVRRSFADFLELYIEYFKKGDFPYRVMNNLALDVGRRYVGRGLGLGDIIASFDVGETHVWNSMTAELLQHGHSADTWLRLASVRDRFAKLVRHYLRQAYLREESSIVRRQLDEFQALSRLGRTIVATVDLEEVLGQVLEVATSLVRVRMGTIMLLDSTRENLEPVVDLGLSRTRAQKIKVPLKQSLSGVAIKRGEFVLAKEDELEAFALPRLPGGRRIRSALSIPITVDEEAIGVIELYDHASRGFTDLDITILTTFGAQAGVAIKNARLFQEERRRRRQATVLTEVTQATSEARDLDELLEKITEKTALALGVDRCSVFFYDPDANALTFMAGYGRSTLQEWLLNQFHIPLSELGQATAKAIRTREPVLVDQVGEELSLEARILRGPSVRSYLQIPLVVEDELIGLVSLEYTGGDGSFSDEDIRLADSICRQAAVAIHNRKLQEKLFEQQLAIKEAEVNERLYIERERSEAVIKATPDAVFLIDADYRVAMLNPSAEFLTGWDSHVAQGRSCHEVLYGEPAPSAGCPRPECPVNRVLGGENVAYSEEEITTRSGRKMPCGGTFAPIYSSDGRVASAVAIYRDISEQKELEKYALIQREMEIASGIQTSLLPRESLLAGGVSIHARQQQARVVGGDWYDYWSYGDKVFLVVGDASGSGVGAALFATMAMSALRVEAREHNRIQEILEHVNRSLFMANQTESFVTVFFGVLDLSTMTLSYSNAGHEEPFYIGAETRSPSTLKSERRSLLGIFSGANLDVQRRKLNSGERLVLYTDGVIDAQSRKGKFYGLKRLNRFIAANRGLPAEEFIEALIGSVLEFCDGEIKDDITVMVCDVP